MSSRVAILPTIFEDYPSGEKSYGFRIYDDYGVDYSNLWNRGDLDLEPLEILRKVVEEASESTGGFLDFVREGEHGIYIGDEWLLWEEIKEVMENY